MLASTSPAKGPRTPDLPSMQFWTAYSKTGLSEVEVEDGSQATTPPAHTPLHAIMMAIMVEQVNSRLSEMQQRQQEDKEDEVEGDLAQLSLQCQYDGDDGARHQTQDCGVELVRQYTPLNLGGLGLLSAFPSPSEEKPSSLGWMNLTCQYTPLNLGNFGTLSLPPQSKAMREASTSLGLGSGS